MHLFSLFTTSPISATLIESGLHLLGIIIGLLRAGGGQMKPIVA